MFAIQTINRLYKEQRYVGVRKDTSLPYLIYEGNSDYPNDIHDFGTQQAALDYLTAFVNRSEINKIKLTTAQVVDIVLVNNCNKFQIVEYEIIEGKLCILNTYPQPQFDRKAVY